MNFGKIEIINNWLNKRKKSLLKKVGSIALINIVVSAISTFSFFSLMKNHNIIEALLAILVFGIAFFSVSLLANSVGYIVSILLDNYDAQSVQINYSFWKNQPSFLLNPTFYEKEDNIKSLINFLISLRLFEKNTLTSEELKQIEANLIYNKAVFKETSFDNVPSIIKNKIVLHSETINEILTANLQVFIKSKLYKNAEFKSLLENASLDEKKSQLKTLEKEKEILEKILLEKTNMEVKTFEDKLNLNGMNEEKNKVNSKSLSL